MANETVNSADSGITTRGFIIGLGVILFGLSLAFHTALKGWLCEYAWFHSALIDGPAVALAIIAWRELDHSHDANVERRRLNEKISELTEEASRANEFRSQRNELEEQNVTLRAQLATSTQQIAENLKRVPTKAERNAEVLRKYKRKMASVSQEGERSAPMALEIVEVDQDNIVTLFSAAGQQGTRAFYNKVDCGDLTVDEMPLGGCSVRVNVVRYQSQPVDLVQAQKWEDRHGAATADPSIDKGGMAWSSSYSKSGSAERRTLNVFQSKDGSNRFQLESDMGWAMVGDNVEVSKHYMAAHIDFLAENFIRSTAGTGAIQGGHKLYIC
jgi:hypothetical protein